MDDRELNEAVAMKLGWVWKEGAMEPIYSRAIGNGKCVATKTLPNYCHAIEAAWEIVEYISKKLDPNGPLEETKHEDGRDRFVGYGFHLEHHSENSSEKWICTLPEIVCAPPYEEMNDDVQEEADTAPRAICLAFLKLP